MRVALVVGAVSAQGSQPKSGLQPLFRLLCEQGRITELPVESGGELAAWLQALLPAPP